MSTNNFFVLLETVSHEYVFLTNARVGAASSRVFCILVGYSSAFIKTATVKPRWLYTKIMSLSPSYKELSFMQMFLRDIMRSCFVDGLLKLA